MIIDGVLRKQGAVIHYEIFLPLSANFDPFHVESADPSTMVKLVAQLTRDMVVWENRFGKLWAGTSVERLNYR